MKRNVGIVDRIIRFVMFDFLVSFTYIDLEVSAFLGTLGFWFAVYILITIVLGYDPIYHIIGINTKIDTKSKAKVVLNDN